MTSLASPRARAAALIIGLCTSCGGGTAGILSALGGDDDDAPPAPIVLSDLIVAGGDGRAAESPASFTLRITDSRSRLVSVEIRAIPPAGDPFAVQLEDDAETVGLASSPTGVVHTFAWEFADQLGSGDAFAPGYRLDARIVGAANAVESALVDVGNDAPTIASVAGPSSMATGTIQLDALLVDSSSDTLDLVAEFQDADTASAWMPLTVAGSGLSQMASSPTGVATSIFWNSYADLPDTAANVRVRVRPSDAWSIGGFTESDTFPVDNNGLPIVGVPIVVGSTRESPVTIEFTIQDLELDPADVEVLYVPPIGAAIPALLAFGSSTTDLPTDGSSIQVEWDFANQLVSGSSYATGSRLRVRALDGGSFQDTIAFAVGNDAAAITSTFVPPAPTEGIVPVMLTVEDSSSDSIAISVEYSILEDGGMWASATLVGTPPTNIAATPSGVPVTVFWDAPADEPGRTATARMRFTAHDGDLASTPIETDPFVIDGNSRPIASVNGSAFFATPDARRGIPLPFRVLDAENDPVRVVFQWRASTGSFPSLPDDPADLDAILVSDDLRRQHQIAVESPMPSGGNARATGASSVCLPEIAAGHSQLLAGVLVGQSVQILRARGAPQPAASAWSANPLSNPVGVLAHDDARTAYVLDGPSVGTWRVQRIDLATGDVIEVVAQRAFGSPSAFAYGAQHDHVFVASDVGGAWNIARVDLATGAVTEIGSVGGAAPNGVVRGLVAMGPTAVLLTVGDALVGVDADAATPTAVLSGLQAPYGLALDPRRDGRVLVAERDGVDPDTMMVTGRVVSVDLATLERRTITTNGPRLLRPESIAIEPGSARLWVVTNAVALDGVRELRQVLLAGGGGGMSAEISAELPDGAGGLSVGTHGLVVLALPGSDLAVSGGVAQERTIASFDVATCTATCSSPFEPALGSNHRWRIWPAAEPEATRVDGLEQRFVWLSTEVAEVGEVVLRAVPYDARRGIASDTGIPRAIRASLDVSPATIGGGASTAIATGITAADLNGDGAVDLAVTSQGADAIAVFLQSSAGTFPTSPNFSLSGIPILAPMTNPVAVRAVDVDGDGDLDLLSANQGSNNFSVCLQVAPGVFATQLLSLGLGVSGPVDIAAGDFNGDGRTDFVTANTSGNNLTVFFQLLAGLYLPLPSLTLGGAATTSSPTSVASGDVDADGDLDIVCASAGSNRVSVFLQTSPGNFPSAPSYSIGGAGITPSPSSIALGDVDGDGRLDIAVASLTASHVSLFLQTSVGTFASTPDVVLASTNGPVGPRQVKLADVDGDGGLDVLSVDSNDELSIFLRDRISGTFPSQAISIDGGGVLSGPRQVATGDFDGDGTVDVAVTNETAGNVALFMQRGGGAFSSTVADLTRGNASDSPGASGIAIADLDADGDLDLAVAAPTSSSIVTYAQWSPAILGAQPRQTIGSSAATLGVSALYAADLDGDGRIDLISANTGAGTLSVFTQQPDGLFPVLPSTTIGGGTLVGVNGVLAADLNADGRLDLVCSNPTSNDFAVFVQSAGGVFAAAPTQRVGGAGVTNGAHRVIAADVDLDGDLDLVTANRTQNTITAFAQTSPGVFAAAPTWSVGSGAATPGPRSVVALDIDRDGRIDLASANSTGNSLTVYLRNADGTFPASPSITLSHALLIGPAVLAAEDLDGDGLPELVCGCTGSQRLLAFRQLVRGKFSTTPQGIGSAAFTPAPGGLEVVDFDGDGDFDLVSPQTTPSHVVFYFGSH